MEDFLDMDFLQELVPVMRHVYFSYSLLGGVYFEDYVHRKLRNFLKILLFLSYSIVTVSALGFMFQQRAHNFIENNIITAPIGFTSNMILSVYSIYLQRKKLRQLFNRMNNRLHELAIPTRSKDQNGGSKKTNIGKIVVVMYKLTLLWHFVFYFGKIAQKVLNSEISFKVDNLYDFLVPVPAVIKIHTFLAYFMVYNVTFLVLLPFGAILLGSFIFPLMVSMYFKNRVIDLTNDMEYHSDLAYECLEECDRREEQALQVADANVSSFRLRDIARQRKRHVEEFMIKAHEWIRIHENLMSSIKLYIDSIKGVFTLQFISSMFAITISTYFFTKTLSGNEEIGVEYACFIVVQLIFFLLRCITGEMLNDVAGKISEAIYSMPWYYLPPKDQKVLLNFLSLAQKSQELRIFDTIPLSLALFPEILNDVYGYIQFMYVLEKR